MNSILSAAGEVQRNAGSRLISKKQRRQPILLVEGKLERAIFRKRWYSQPKESRVDISVEFPSTEGRNRNGVLKEFAKRIQSENIFALVDMDHDFGSNAASSHSNIFDTSPLVTLPSFAMKGKESATYICKYISAGIRVMESKADEVYRLSKALTIVKLFKGYAKSGGEFGNFAWSDVNFSLLEDAVFNAHVFSIELGDTILPEIQEFKRNYETEIKNCGVNDHMLFYSWKLCYKHHFPDTKPQTFRQFEKGLLEPEIIKFFGQKREDIVCHIRQKILL